MTAATEAKTLTPPPVATEGGDGSGPTHVAIIMDGNGRWAQRRGLPRAEGHRRGVEALRRTVRAAIDRNIRFLTVYTFSSENWRRPPAEVTLLMGLLRRFFRKDLDELIQKNVRIRVIGDRADLAPDIDGILREAEAKAVGNTGMTLVIAFNYGGRQEIARAAQRLAREVLEGRLPVEAIDCEAIEARLDTAGIPDPDLVIRTSGEQRISNFLPWQAAYAEFVFTPLMWPDFDGAALDAAITEFHRRERRFGGLGAAGV